MLRLPKYTWVMVWLGFAPFLMAPPCAWGQVNSGLSAPNQAANPQTLATILERAQTLLHPGGDAKVAVELLTSALAENPTWGAGYYYRGRANFDLRAYRLALADFTAAMRYQAKNEDVYRYRGFTRLELRDYSGAMADFSQVIRVNPRNAVAWRLRAQARASLQDYRGALGDYNQLLRLEGSDAFHYLNRGIVREKLQDYQGAIADYTTAIQIVDTPSPPRPGQILPPLSFSQPFRFRFVEARAAARIKIKDYAGAMADFTDLIERHRNSHYYILRADLRLQLRDIAGAAADYDQAIQANPLNYEAYQRRSLFRESQGDHTGAIADYQIILEKASQDVWAKVWVERATLELQR